MRILAIILFCWMSYFVGGQPLGSGGAYFGYRVFPTVALFRASGEVFLVSDRVKILDTGAEFTFSATAVPGYSNDSTNYIPKGSVYAKIDNSQGVTAGQIGLTKNNTDNDSWALQRHINYCAAADKVVNIEFGMDSFRIVRVSVPTAIKSFSLKGNRAVFSYPDGSYNSDLSTVRQLSIATVGKINISGIDVDGRRGSDGVTWTNTLNVLPDAAWYISYATGDTIQRDASVLISDCSAKYMRCQFFKLTQTDEYPALTSDRWRKGYDRINIEKIKLNSVGGGVSIRGLNNFVNIDGILANLDTTMIFGISTATSLVSITTEQGALNYIKANVKNISTSYGIPYIFIQNCLTWNIDNINVNKGSYYLRSGVQKRILEDFRNSPGDPYGYPSTYMVKVDNVCYPSNESTSRLSNVYLTNCASNNYGGWNIVEGTSDVLITNFKVTGKNYFRLEDPLWPTCPPKTAIISNGYFDGDCGPNCTPILAQGGVRFSNVRIGPFTKLGTPSSALNNGMSAGFHGKTIVSGSDFYLRNFILNPRVNINDTTIIDGCTFVGGWNILEGGNAATERSESVLFVRNCDAFGFKMYDTSGYLPATYDSLRVIINNSSAYFFDQESAATTANNLHHFLCSPVSSFQNMKLIDPSTKKEVDWWPNLKGNASATIIKSVGFQTNAAISGPVTITIPSGRVGGKKGLDVWDAYGAIGTHSITLTDAGGAGFIEHGVSASTLVLSHKGQFVHLESNGTNWIVTYNSL